jgi:hypothetical protein
MCVYPLRLLASGVLRSPAISMTVLPGLQISKMLAESKARVQRLLESKRAQLHAVAAALVEQETLDAVQITAVCDGVDTSAASAPGAAEVGEGRRARFPPTAHEAA